jgi:hypothetical protein
VAGLALPLNPWKPYTLAAYMGLREC